MLHGGPGSDELVAALGGLGVQVMDLQVGAPSAPGVLLSWDDRHLVLQVGRMSQVTAARARELIGATDPGPTVIVADRITAEARMLLNAANWSWLDLRGHLHLRGEGLFIDTAVTATTKVVRRSASAVRGKAGLAVGYWLCAHPEVGLSPTGQSAELGFAPSTISAALAALAEAGLVDEHRRAVLPELFWELVRAWRPEWTWLASRPAPGDLPGGLQEAGWVRTGDAVAAAHGAPLVTAGEGALEVFVADPVTLAVAMRRYGTAQPGAGPAVIAVAPVAQIVAARDGGHLQGWRTAPDLAVALGLATDPARGREILRDWAGEDHVWR